MKMHKNHLRLLILLLLVLLACVGYMTVGVHFENQKLFAYAMRIRTPKLIAMLITAFAIGPAALAELAIACCAACALDWALPLKPPPCARQIFPESVRKYQ